MRSLKNLCILAFLLLICWGCGGMSFSSKPEAANTEVFSPMPAEQLLKMAEDRFKAGKFDAAIRAYEEFEKAHSRSELLPYSIFGRGLCYFERRETFDRDSTATRKAEECFRRVVEKYPGWKYARDAERNIMECRRLLAENEFYIASFYQRTGRHRSALARYQSLLRDFQDFPKAAEVQKGIAECEAELVKAPKQKGLVAKLFDAQW